MGFPQRRRPAPPLACKKLFNFIRYSGKGFGQHRECVCAIERTGWFIHLVVRYLHLVRRGFLYSILSPGAMRGAQNPALRRRSCVTVYANHIFGSKNRPGRGPRRTMRWCHPEYERGVTRRKSTFRCDTPIVSSPPPNLKGGARRELSSRALPMIFGSNDRGCIAPCGLPRAQRPTACKNKRGPGGKPLKAYVTASDGTRVSRVRNRNAEK